MLVNWGRDVSWNADDIAVRSGLPSRTQAGCVSSARERGGEAPPRSAEHPFAGAHAAQHALLGDRQSTGGGGERQAVVRDREMAQQGPRRHRRPPQARTADFGGGQPAARADALAELLEEVLLVGIVHEDPAAFDAAGDDVVQRTGRIEARAAGHRLRAYSYGSSLSSNGYYCMCTIIMARLPRLGTLGTTSPSWPPLFDQAQPGELSVNRFNRGFSPEGRPFTCY